MILEPIYLDTERLFIRTYKATDAGALHQFVKDNVFFLYETGPMTLRNNTSVARSKAFLKYLDQERMAGKWMWNGVFLKNSNQLLGQVSIYNLNDETKDVELGYFITADEMGKGYATEALKAIIAYCFSMLQITKLVLRIKPDNIASRRVAEKLGFQTTGLKEKAFKTYHDEWIDQMVFELKNDKILK